MAEACLVARGVTKKFFRKGRESAQWFDAVSKADLQIAPGEFCVLMGRSGSGKSTLLNMAGGLLEPSEGAVLLQGDDLYALPDGERSRMRNERIGVVPQGQTPLHSLTVVQNVTLPYLMYRSDDGVEARALELLDSLGVRQLADAYPRELSGGEMRRMAIARALVCDPVVVLADEPTSDLDDENTQVVLQKLRDVADGGAAVLVATHDQAALSFADRVLRMDAGVLMDA
ncbi:MAG: ABC transporter ATP-binding protein [Coriobacteriaceae bacterium]|nr:ABC transporter ATP-binding protein [Coriobacteriaceae bacterium]